MKRLLVVCILAGLAAAPANAAVATFTDVAAWQAAAGPSTLEDFSGSPLGAMAAGSTDIGAFSIFLDKNGGGNNAFSAPRFGGYIDDPTASLDVGALVLRFDFDAPLIGFGGDWTSMINADRVTVTLAGATIQFDNFLTTGNGDGFLGFVSTTPFTSLQFGLELASPGIDGERFTLDNARLAAAVAEPPAAALLAVALLAAGTWRRRGPAKAC